MLICDFLVSEEFLQFRQKQDQKRDTAAPENRHHRDIKPSEEIEHRIDRDDKPYHSREHDVAVRILQLSTRSNHSRSLCLFTFTY